MPRMNLVLYENGMSIAGKRLLSRLSNLFHNNRAEIYHTIDSLSNRLRQPGKNHVVAVLLASDWNDLSGLFTIRDLLRDLRTIVILPDQERETILRGHELFPRFLSYADGNFGDVAVVAERMLEIGDPEIPRQAREEKR